MGCLLILPLLLVPVQQRPAPAARQQQPVHRQVQARQLAHQQLAVHQQQYK